MTNIVTISEWQRVPARVAALLPRAVAARTIHEKAGAAAYVLANTVATWVPETKQLTVYSPTELNKQAASSYTAALAADGWGCEFRALAETQPDSACEVVVKIGSLVPGLPAVWNTGNKLLAGPTPLSNGIMAGLLAGGAGYGAGALAEYLFPERYI